MATDMDRAKRIKMFKNGDYRFYGKTLVINKRTVRNFDSFLSNVTSEVKFSEAVRSIRTPNHGTRVTNLDDLKEGTAYVACGNTRFKRIENGYQELENHVPPKQTSPRVNMVNAEQHKPLEIKPVAHSKRYNNISGRSKSVPTSALTIFMFANEDDKTPPKRLLLTPREMSSWDQVLQAIDEKVSLDGYITRVYTLDWEQITDVRQFVNAQHYVAVGKKPLKKFNYGQVAVEFQTSPKLNRRKFQPDHSRNRKSRASDNSNSTYQSNNSKDTQHTSTRQSRGFALQQKGGGHAPNQEPDSVKDRSPAARRQPLPQQRRAPPKKDDGVFRAKPTRHSRSPGGRQVDYDKDEGGVFKAKGKNTETDGAQEVDDTRDTQVDLPIDQVEAEEVKDEDIGRSRSPSPQPNEVANNSMEYVRTPTPRRLTPIHRSSTLRKSNTLSPERTFGRPNRTPTPQQRPASTQRSLTPLQREQTPKPQSRDPTPKPRTPTPQARDPTPKPRTPTPQARDPTPKPRTPTPQARTPTPKERTPTPKERTPTPKDRTPTPQARTPTPEVEDSRERDEAATRIQAGYKGYKTRQWMAKRQAERQSKQQEESQRQQAATKIQANYRGYKVRQGLKHQQQPPSPKPNSPAQKEEEEAREAAVAAAAEESRENEKKDDKEEQQARERDDAATRIQASYKGYKVRRDLKERRESEQGRPESEAVVVEEDKEAESEQKDDEVKEEPAERNDEAEQGAATRIQASFRGYQDRKKVREMRGHDDQAPAEGDQAA